MKENTRLEGDRVVVHVAPKPGQHVRRTGEDTRAGERVLEAGGALIPTRIALASSQGLAELEVARRSTVAVFITGDELVEPGLPIAPGQIFNSNRAQLMGLLRADGLETVASPAMHIDPVPVESE